MTTYSIEQIEKAIGYTVSQAIAEYLNGDYGDVGEWTAEQAAEVELGGDAGDQIRRHFSDYEAAAALWERAIIEDWPR